MPQALRENLALIVGVIGCAVILYALAGCAPIPAPDTGTVAVGTGLGKIDASAVSADQGAKRLVPLVKPEGRTILSWIRDNIAAIREGTAEAESAMGVVQANAAKLYGHVLEEKQARVRAEQQLADERGHWFGYQLRHWGKIITVTVVVGWLALGALGVFMPTSGIGRFALNLMPAANPFSYLRNRMA